MKRVLYVLAGLTFVLQLHAQLVTELTVPQRFTNKNIIALPQAYTKGNFIELDSVVHYVNIYRWSPGDSTAYIYIFKLSNDSLKPIDSISILSNENVYDHNMPEVVNYRDTLFIRSGRDVYKWKTYFELTYHAGSVYTHGRSLTANQNGQPFINDSTLFYYYDSGIWNAFPLNHDSFLRKKYFIDFPEELLIMQTYFMGDSLIIDYLNDTYIYKDSAVVDTLDRQVPGFGTNPNVLGVENSTIYVHHNQYYISEYKNGIRTFLGSGESDKFWSCTDIAVKNGRLWLIGWKFGDILNTGSFYLYYYDGEHWQKASTLDLQSVYNVNGSIYVDGKTVGILEDFSFVKGQIYFDNNTNCLFDSNELTRTYRVWLNDNEIFFTDKDGKYTLLVPTDKSSKISVELPEVATDFNCNSDSIVISPSPFDTTYFHDFIFQPDSGSTDIELNISNRAVRRGSRFNGQIRVSNNAIGSVDSFTVSFKFDSLLTDFKSTFNHNQSGNTVWFSVSGLSGLEELYIPFNLFADTGNLDLGDTVCLTAMHLFNDSISHNNVDTICSCVIDPHDPNIKTSFPQGEIRHKIDKIDYTIEFQNVGTAPAINVTVIDTVDTRLPLRYLKVTGTSHPATYNLQVLDNVLIWTFKGINLPDSGTYLQGSKGYISYEAKLSGQFNVPGDQIDNRAYIYFDYESPVVTNTASVFIPEASNSVWPDIFADSGLRVYPNPFNSYIKIANPLPENQDICIYDSRGRMVHHEILAQGESIISTAELSPGVYFLRSLSSGYHIRLVKY